MMLGAVLLLSGCNSTGEGAYVGGQFGYVLGSAIGGITGGGRGHDWGALIGTVSGAATGAAVGAAKENARHERVLDRARPRNNDEGYGNRERSRYDQGGQAVDRVDLGLLGPGESPLEIRNARIEESKHDGVLTRGEECTVRFEIHNVSDRPVFDVRPIVGDVTGNKHVKISPNLLIENIGPHQGVRYSATILADKKLKEGEIKVMVAVSHELQEVKSQTRYFTVPTARGVR